MLEMRQNRIHDILRQQGRSIYWLAKQANISYAAIHRLVTSQPIPDTVSYGTLRRVSQVLDVSVDDLEKEEK